MFTEELSDYIALATLKRSIVAPRYLTKDSAKVTEPFVPKLSVNS